jgi:hypothetical protein
MVVFVWSDWTFSPEEEAAVAPKGWATSSSGGWVDDSAAAAGSFFDRAPCTHKQSGGSGWSESSPALDSRCANPFYYLFFLRFVRGHSIHSTYMQYWQSIFADRRVLHKSSTLRS